MPNVPPSPSIDQLRGLRGAAMRENLDDAVHGVRAVERAGGSVHDFDFVDVFEGEIGEIDRAARLVHRRSVDEHFRVIRIAAVEEK